MATIGQPASVQHGKQIIWGTIDDLTADQVTLRGQVSGPKGYRPSDHILGTWPRSSLLEARIAFIEEDML